MPVILAKQSLLSRFVKALDASYASVAIVGAGAILRLLYLLLIVGKPFSSDAESYVKMAADMTAGRPFIPFWPPGVPLYLVCVHDLFGSSTAATRIAMMAFYLGLSYFLFQATTCLTGKRIGGNIVLLLLAIWPGFVILSVEPVTETPAAMFLCMTAYCLLFVRYDRKLSRNLLTMAGLGLALGCLSLIRPASLALVAFVPLYCVWRTRRLLCGGLALLIPALMVLIWIAHVHDMTGSFVLVNTANARNLYLGNNPKTPIYRTWWLGSHHDADANIPAQVSDQAASNSLDKNYNRLARTYISEHPGLFLLRTFNRMSVFLAFDTYAGDYVIQTYQCPRIVGLLAIAFGGLLYCTVVFASICYLGSLTGKDQPIWASTLAAMILIYAAPYFVAFSHPRYRIPVEPILMMFCAALLVQLAGTSSREIRSKLLSRKWELLTAMCFFLFVQIEFAMIMSRLHV